jgi:peroxiredoxin
MPAIQNIYREYHDQGLEVVAINATNQDNPSEAFAFVKANELTFPILMDIDGNVSRLYQLQALPTTFFVNSTGKIQDVVVGGPMAETLIRVRVNQLLEEASR